MNRHYLLDPAKATAVESCDVLIIGSGIAGMMTALQLADEHQVYLITKHRIIDGSTRFAQGGIAFAIDEDDSTELHIKDTMTAGVNFCDPEAVRILVEEGPARYRELIELGTKFDRHDDKISLHREGGHSRNRIVHSGDATGEEVVRSLVAAVEKNENITVLENAFMLDLLNEAESCTGALVIHKNELFRINAQATVLATGGAGQMFSITTSPAVATGDGIAAALRAGARLADMEFIQFHPTALHEEKNPRFLITEAIRGVGALILDNNKQRFMHNEHPLAELAPRDVVVRNMAFRMIESGEDHLYLDIRHFDDEKLAGFPMISMRLAEKGYNVKKDLLPISFAAHYTIGGVATDYQGRTTLPNLFACGETSCTGVHGANRLASNSLLEGLVFSKRISNYIIENYSPRAVPKPLRSGTGDWQPDPEEITELKDRLGAAMIRYGGVFRAEKRLAILHDELNIVTKQSSDKEHSLAWYELQNMLLLARCVHDAGMMRTESRGAHQRQEFHEFDPRWQKRHIVFEQGSHSIINNLSEGIIWK